MVQSTSLLLTWNMSHSLISRHRPLPFAPRPFEAEVLSGWIGRIASRYRMSVQALAATCELDLQMPDGRKWLLMPKLQHQMVGRLAALTRISTQAINDIRVPLHWDGPRAHFCYCARCVFLNPLDVTAPIWRREWLDQSQPGCSVHGDEFRTLPASRVLACTNLDELLAVVSRQERDIRYGVMTKAR
jgi:TniQ